MNRFELVSDVIKLWMYFVTTLYFCAHNILSSYTPDKQTTENYHKTFLSTHQHSYFHNKVMLFNNNNFFLYNIVTISQHKSLQNKSINASKRPACFCMHAVMVALGLCESIPKLN